MICEDLLARFATTYHLKGDPAFELGAVGASFGDWGETISGS